MALLFILLWLVSGAASFIYWWTVDHDFELKTLFLMFIVSITGPLAFLIGAFIHGDLHAPSKVLIKRRKKEI